MPKLRRWSSSGGQGGYIDDLSRQGPVKGPVSLGVARVLATLRSARVHLSISMQNLACTFDKPMPVCASGRACPSHRSIPRWKNHLGKTTFGRQTFNATKPKQKTAKSLNEFMLVTTEQQHKDHQALPWIRRMQGGLVSAQELEPCAAQGIWPEACPQGAVHLSLPSSQNLTSRETALRFAALFSAGRQNLDRNTVPPAGTCQTRQLGLKCPNCQPQWSPAPMPQRSANAFNAPTAHSLPYPCSVLAQSLPSPFPVRAIQGICGSCKSDREDQKQQRHVTLKLSLTAF